MTATAHRRRSLLEDPERFEVGTIATAPPCSSRLLATAATLGGARLAVRTLAEEGGVDPLTIRDTATGRWITR